MCVYVNIIAKTLAMNTTIDYVVPNLGMNEQNISILSFGKKHQLYKWKKKKNANLKKLYLFKYILWKK